MRNCVCVNRCCSLRHSVIDSLPLDGALSPGSTVSAIEHSVTLVSHRDSCIFLSSSPILFLLLLLLSFLFYPPPMLPFSSPVLYHLILYVLSLLFSKLNVMVPPTDNLKQPKPPWLQGHIQPVKTCVSLSPYST